MQNIVIVLVGLVLITLIIIFISKSIRTMIPSLIAFYFLILISLFTYNSKQVESFLQKEVDITSSEKKEEIEKKPAQEINKEWNEKDENRGKVKKNIILDAPIIKQFPELPRGCEVTSLAMFFQYYDIKVNKMDLAKKVKKDKTPLTKRNGKIFWGNPNDGFIGDMYSFNNPGYGVYHKPILDLAEEYLPGKIVNLTGSNLEDLKRYLSNNRPIWIITNASYDYLPSSSFEKWNTPSGEINITYRLHSVLITGYDEANIYFNDPIDGKKNKQVPIQPFIKAWEQMGSQAISLNL